MKDKTRYTSITITIENLLLLAINDSPLFPIIEVFDAQVISFLVHRHRCL